VNCLSNKTRWQRIASLSKGYGAKDETDLLDYARPKIRTSHEQNANCLKRRMKLEKQVTKKLKKKYQEVRCCRYSKVKLKKTTRQARLKRYAENGPLYKQAFNHECWFGRPCCSRSKPRTNCRSSINPYANTCLPIAGNVETILLAGLISAAFFFPTSVERVLHVNPSAVT